MPCTLLITKLSREPSSSRSWWIVDSRSHPIALSRIWLQFAPHKLWFESLCGKSAAAGRRRGAGGLHGCRLAIRSIQSDRSKAPASVRLLHRHIAALEARCNANVCDIGAMRRGSRHSSLLIALGPHSPDSLACKLHFYPAKNLRAVDHILVGPSVR